MRKNEMENLVEVKLALSEKYLRRARASNSKPRKAVMLRQAERFRRQAEDARRAVNAIGLH